MIKTILFDFGGVVINLNQPQAVERYKEIGLADADRMLDAYTQGGIFGELESGQITAEEFRAELGKLIGHEVTEEQCRYAWTGYCGGLPEKNLETLRRLRAEGYRLVLVSNTNPFMMSWACSSDFDGNGHPLDDYFDAMYMSYKIGAMKPDERFFRKMIEDERLNAAEALFLDDGLRNIEAAARFGIHTLHVADGSDWTADVWHVLDELNTK